MAWINGIRVANRDSVIPPDSLVCGVLGTAPLFAPGTGFHCSDMNYVLVGLILERVRHGTYYQMLQRDITALLKLNDTEPAVARHVRDLASGYENPRGRQPAKRPSPPLTRPFLPTHPRSARGGGLVSTATDLARWFHALFGGGLLSATRPAC